MKRSILSLSAAVALGGLGFAGSANALSYFGPAPNGSHTVPSAVVPNPAVFLAQHAAGTGHMLLTPYFTAQGSMGTLVTITNTDMQNGKAVKVRFRSATNSDDVLDFTLFLSPGDVWSAQITRGDNEHAVISTPDKSCTIPEAAEWPGVFRTERLAEYLSASVLAQHTREGYVEVLNMADIPPTLRSDGQGTVNAGVKKDQTNKVFTAIKHVKGVAPCTSTAFADLLDDTIHLANGAQAEGYGLAGPTGGLMGTFSLFNQEQLASFGGNMTAIVASRNGWGPNQTLTSDQGFIAFAPQIETPIANQPTVLRTTADPMLRSAVAVDPLWYDLPDMSTPLATNYANDPLLQAMVLSNTMTKAAVFNDYVATAAGAAVPMDTDWVVSQPTRRYHAVVEYGDSAANADIRWNINMADGSAADTTTVVRAAVLDVAGGAIANAGNVYKPLAIQQGPFGPQGCVTLRFSSADREESFSTAGGGFSPGQSNPFCGEVFTAQFSGNSVLQAAVTKRALTPVGQAGWARLTTTTGATGAHTLPVLGFAATSIKNTETGGNFGVTTPHRWVGLDQIP